MRVAVAQMPAVLNKNASLDPKDLLSGRQDDIVWEGLDGTVCTAASMH
jgi:hypothetical protein